MSSYAARVVGFVAQAVHLRPAVVSRLTSRWLAEPRGRRAYRELTEAELRATRRSDTAFVFGSGTSLRDISADEWSRIAEHSTIGFSEFARQRFVRVDYHMIGEVKGIERYAGLLRNNPFYADTVYLVQRGWLADDSNELVARRLLPENARIFRYRRTSRGAYAPPSRSFRDGLVHGWNSSISATNFAILMGFRRIVLTGIDLYDKQYFWLAPGERRDALRPSESPEQPFPMADLIVDVFGRWGGVLEPEGIELFAYNPRSRLAQALDVFAWE
jgi:hypothetical protein